MQRPLVLLIAIVLVGCENRKQPNAGPDSGSTTVERESTTVSSASLTSPSSAPTELEALVRGKPFRPDHIVLEGNTLRFRQGTETAIDTEIRFDLPVPEGERLNGREWKIGGRFGEQSLSLTSRVAGFFDHSLVHGPEYETTIRFTKQSPTSVEGIIDIRFKYLEKTYLRGPFTAEYRKSPTGSLDEHDAPFIQGKITLKGNEKAAWDVTAGFVGIGTDGKPYSNSAGFPLMIGQGAVVTNTRASQVTTMTNDVTAGLIFRHIKMPPGDYLVYVRRGDVMFAWERVTLKAADQKTVNLTIDMQKAGEVKFQLSKIDTKADERMPIALVPIGIDMPDLGPDGHHFFTVVRAKPGETSPVVAGIPAGRYRAIFGTLETIVEVVGGMPVTVSLIAK